MQKFVTRIRARYCETDAAGVVYYGSFMQYFEVGKMEMYRELRLSYNRHIPIVETHCGYPAPTFFDDLLEIRTWFDDVGRSSFKIRSQVYRVEAEGKFVLVGEGYTTHVHVDDDRNAVPFPSHYEAAFKKVGIERG